MAKNIQITSQPKGTIQDIFTQATLVLSWQCTAQFHSTSSTITRIHHRCDANTSNLTSLCTLIVFVFLGHQINQNLSEKTRHRLPPFCDSYIQTQLLLLLLSEFHQNTHSISIFKVGYCVLLTAAPPSKKIPPTAGTAIQQRPEHQGQNIKVSNAPRSNKFNKGHAASFGLGALAGSWRSPGRQRRARATPGFPWSQC